MFSKFLNINIEKQEFILNAAMKEFSQKGFEKASTNEIIKEAGISKGLLFHYFTNKKTLFLFLYDYSIDKAMNEFYKKIDIKEIDVFIRLQNMVLVKLDLLKKYPELFSFITSAYFEESLEVKNDLNLKSKEAISGAYNNLFTDIETNKFREDIDLKKTLNIITWSLNGLSSEIQKKAKLFNNNEIDYEKAIVEMNFYIDILKKGFYK